MKYLLTSQIYKSDQNNWAKSFVFFNLPKVQKSPNFTRPRKSLLYKFVTHIKNILYIIHIYKNFHCDRHLTIKRTYILKSSLNADELCQEIELFSLDDDDCDSSWFCVNWTFVTISRIKSFGINKTRNMSASFQTKIPTEFFQLMTKVLLLWLDTQL